MIKLMTSTAIIVALATAPALAGYEMRFALIAGQVWNGTASSFVTQFSDKPACEAAFVAYKADGQAKIAAARPGITFSPVFWHVCSPLNSAVPS